jgi:hypothetical protein
MAAFQAGSPARRGAPCQCTAPASGRISPAMMRSSVDVPLPLSPVSISH